MKYYVVADVHGYYDYMVEALQEKGFFEDKEPHKLVVCGDIYDRGPQNKEVENFVAQLLDKDEITDLGKIPAAKKIWDQSED